MRDFRKIPQISSVLYRVSLVLGDLPRIWSM
jgi:hypothetical protein